MKHPTDISNPDPFADVQAATRQHRREHGCGAYTFEDGPALIRLAGQQRPMRILELGTALGYTACCLAYGSPPARVDTIEADSEHVALARAQIARHDLSTRVVVHHGTFDTVLKTLQPVYNLAFFDGFTPTLDTVLKMRELLVAGGLLVCSNLQLGSGDEAARLAAELADSSHWQSCDPIESGRTAVLIKRS
jgi:predicted O-methyltransferase YrrM